MTNAELRTAMDDLDITAAGFGRMVGAHERTVRRWMADGSVPRYIALIIHLLRANPGELYNDAVWQL